MSKSKYKLSTLSALIDSDDEEDQLVAGMPTPDSVAENQTLGKKGRGKQSKDAPSRAIKATKVTKAESPARRLSGRLNGRSKVPAEKNVRKGKRPALADVTNQQHASDTEEVDEFDNDDVPMEDAGVEEHNPEVKKSKAKVAARKPAASKASKVKDVPNQTKQHADGQAQASILLPKRRGRPAKKELVIESSPEKVVMETQVDDMEIDGDVNEESIEVEETVTRSSQNAVRPQVESRHRQNSVSRRRAGSASDTERSDPTLRRKLGEMTKKYDALNIKYQDLREVGLKAAERNIDKLKKTNDEKPKSFDLIASLKLDVAQQTVLARESKVWKKKFDVQATDMAVLQAQFAQMKASLSEAQAENKTLSIKLAAHRTASSSVESMHSKVPGSAVKAGAIRMVGTAEAAQLAQAAQLKEDIYRDLTGLIIQGVKREPEEDVFNCLQTGRNGTLHFKLATANEKSSESYDDAQCTYVPQLDPSRDRSLMEVLPDYLVDEITFPRPHAAKFYARVVRALAERFTTE